MYAKPAPFTQSGGNGLGLTFATITQGGELLSCPDMGFQDLKANFGMLLGKPINGICLENATTQEEFGCGMDLASAYKGREWGFFNTIVSAALLNAANRFLPAVISPIFETSEMNFTVEQSTISAMPFTEIAECGIPEEPGGGYTYAFKQTVSRYAQGCTFSRDLMLDENFGSEAWLRMLGSFVSNARLTIDMGIITTVVQTGYENMRRAKTEGCPIDHHKQWLNESAGFFIFAQNPESGFVLIGNLGEDIKGMDTLIFPKGKSAYLRDVIGDSQTIMVQKLSTDAPSGRAMMEFVDGPRSFKTIRWGDGDLNIIEFTPFYVGDIGLCEKDCMRINPLATNITIGQFYPPNPFLTLDVCVKANCGEINNIRIFNQTKTIGQFVDITLRQRLENSIYFDKKTGKVSRTAHDFARVQTQRRGNSPSQIPWDWNPQNPKYLHDADINKETTSNSEVDLAEVNGLANFGEMTSWRDEPVILTYKPSTGEFKIPKRVGDFHLRSIPNDWIKLAADYLEAKFNEENPHRTLEEGFVQLKKLVSAIRHSAWTDAYLFGLLNKNVPKMIAATREGFRLVPERTPLIRVEKKGTNNKNPRDQCKFPGADVIEEVKTNRFGGWDLPDKDGAMLTVYPPGFDNGVGIQTLAQEALKEGSSLWFQPGREAMEATLFGETLLKFMQKYMGKPDVINPRFLPPWVHKVSGLTALLDNAVRAAGPVHVGIPATINFIGENGPTANPLTQKANLADNTPILRATVELTRLLLEAEVRDAPNGPRRIINNETRALACLSEPVYAKMRTIDETLAALGGDDAFRAETYAALHKVYDNAVEMCKPSISAAQHKINVETNSIIMNAFYDLVALHVAALADAVLLPTAETRDTYRKDTIVKALRGFVANFKNVSGMKRFLADERKKLSPICVDYGEGFVDALRKYEQSPKAGRPVEIAGRGEDFVGFTNTVAPVYRADYSAAPSKFLRAPLASSQALRDYLRDKLNPWILPSDYNLFYAYPEEPRIVTGDSTIEVSVHKNKFDLCSLARSKVFQCKLNSKKGNPSSSSVSAQKKRTNAMEVEDDEDDEDFFSSLSSKKSTGFSSKSKGSGSSSLSMGKILSMGKNYNGMDDDDEERDDPYYRNAFITEKSRQQQINPETGEVELNQRMAEEYFGPWKARLEYQVKEISTLGITFLFGAIIQSKNRLDTYVKMAATGAVLLDAFLVRPFIEVRTSAIIAMKGGSETMLTTIGHSHVQVTKESRGCWHIDVTFLMGVIMIQRCNIMLIPHAFPESLIGGKGVTFITDPANQLRLPNPAKPSLFSVLVSPNERQYEGRLHMSNGDPIVRPDTNYAFYLGKHSAGRWVEHFLGAQTIQNIDIATQGRETYASCLSQANVLSQGPAIYINPRTLREEDVEGNGPMGSFSMNMPGVQDVYEGRAQRFPDRLQKYTYVNTC